MAKLWIYTAVVCVIGSWFSPFLFNAAMALTEVSSQKTLNGPLRWLAGLCADTGLWKFQTISMLLAAVALFLPWVNWLTTGHLALRRPPAMGQALQPNPNGPRQLVIGLLSVCGVCVLVGLAMVPLGMANLRPGTASLLGQILLVLPWTLVLAALIELMMRGVVFGLFLRSFPPLTAMALAAFFYALAWNLFPNADIDVPDPESSGAGFTLFGETISQLGTWRGMMVAFLPMLVLGFILGYARWRTASLWLPIGLHAGIMLARTMISSVLEFDVLYGFGSSTQTQQMLSGVGIVAALVMVSLLARNDGLPHHER